MAKTTNFGKIPAFTLMGSIVGGLAGSWGGAIVGALFGFALDSSFGKR